jgi:thymidylate synthase
MNKLLKGLEENPFGRRHKISLWQEQQVIDDPKSLEPCAGLTLWSVRDVKISKEELKKQPPEFNVNAFTRYIDLTLIQRSQDYITTSSINNSQYTMLAMMVANHLTFKTGIRHEVGKLLHIVQNCHIYDRHLDAAKEILKRESTGLQPKIELICEPKLFRLHTIEDFKFSGLEGIEKLSNNLEIAI